MNLSIAWVLTMTSTMVLMGLSACTSDDTSGDKGKGGDDEPPTATWDWAGVVGTGQSLAVGQNGTPAFATEQPYANLKLNTGTAMWPMDSNDPSFALEPLVEP